MNLKRFAWLACLVPLYLGFGIISTHAYWRDGNQLHEACKRSGMIGYGYIFGVIDGYEVGIEEGAPRYMCIPENVVAEQLFDIVCQYTAGHPKERQRPASYLVMSALTDAWGCSGVSRKK